MFNAKNNKSASKQPHGIIGRLLHWQGGSDVARSWRHMGDHQMRDLGLDRVAVLASPAYTRMFPQ